MKQDSKNYYEILEVSPEASQSEISEAYNRAKNAYSGSSIALYSIMTEDECQAILEMVEEAYAILGEPGKRSQYDKARGFNTNRVEEIKTNSDAENLADLAQEMNQNNSESNSQNYFQNYSKEEHKKKIKSQAPVQEDFKLSQRKEAEVSKVSAKNRFSLKYSIDDNFEEEIGKCQDFTGEFLQKIREYKGVDIERMSDMTKISKTYIRNIEAEDRDNLPADVYVRGFVYQYAKTLKLNPDLVASSYIQRIRSQNQSS